MRASLRAWYRRESLCGRVVVRFEDIAHDTVLEGGLADVGGPDDVGVPPVEVLEKVVGEPSRLVERDASLVLTVAVFDDAAEVHVGGEQVPRQSCEVRSAILSLSRVLQPSVAHRGSRSYRVGDC